MSTIWVKLEIKGDDSDADTVVDHVLDNGDFQDAINSYAEDTGRDVEVESITWMFEPATPVAARVKAQEIYDRSRSETECNDSDDAAELAKLVLGVPL